MLKRKTKNLNFFERCVLVINYAAAFALLISYFAPYVNPVNFWPVSFFGMAYMPLLCTNAICLVFWLVRLRYQAAISASCITLGLGLITLNIGFHKQTFEVTKADTSYMRVMSYNVYDFGNAADSRRYFTYDTILNIINREQPDVVNMQEYLVHIDDKVNMGVAVREAMKTRYIWFKPVITTKVDTTGIVMFSKYPVIGQDTIPTLNGIATEGMYMDVKKAGRIVRIYNLHMQSTRFSRADNAYLDSLSKKGSASLHESRSIVAKIKLAFINRAKQVAELKKLFAKCPYPYIITGDFNDTPLSYSVNNMARGIKNAFVEKGYGLGVTFYGEYPGFQLDYIMASPQFNIINYKIIRERISDHYPVISDLELK